MVWAGAVVTNLRAYAGVCLEGMGKTHEKPHIRQPVSGLRSEPLTSRIPDRSDTHSTDMFCNLHSYEPNTVRFKHLFRW
jgi:hypothetical protein